MIKERYRYFPTSAGFGQLDIGYSLLVIGYSKNCQLRHPLIRRQKKL